VCRGWLRSRPSLFAASLPAWRPAIERIDIAPDGISVTLHAAGIRSLIAELAERESPAPGRLRTLVGARRVMTGCAALELDTLTIRIPIQLQRWGGRKLIMTPEGVAAPARKPSRDEALVKALVRAHCWRRRIESGQAKSITDLAEQEGGYGRLHLPAPAAYLPGARHRGGVLDGRQSKGLRATEILVNGPLGWEEQRLTRDLARPTRFISWPADNS
jgi:hypothetical protein